MNLLARGTLVLAATVAAAQPCLAAGATQPGAGKVAPVRFNLSQPIAASGVAASMTLAASQRTAAETPEQKPARRGPSTTLLVVGGAVLLVVLIAAAVAGATPTAGPPKGAFD